MRYDTLKDAQAAGAAPWTQEAEGLSGYYVAVYEDAYPVTRGHLLFVPRWNNNDGIHEALKYAFNYGQSMVATERWEAFNVGMNFNEAAGQTVMYPHVHLIPRTTGDCADPTGGVRGVIFGQANYRATGYSHPDK